MRARDILPDGVDQMRIDGATFLKGSVGAFLASAALPREPGSTADERDLRAIADTRR